MFKLFKKSEKTIVKSTIEKIEKSQLEKVIGGGGPDVVSVDGSPLKGIDVKLGKSPGGGCSA